jgi:hypothetical protein
MLAGGTVLLREVPRTCIAAKAVVATNVNLCTVSIHHPHPHGHNDLPKERREDNRSHTAAVEGAFGVPNSAAPARRHRDKSREPKQQCQELDAEDGELVCGAWEARWGEGEVCYREQRPHRGEEHEGHTGGRPCVVGG